MYVINCSKVLTDFEGEPIKDGMSDNDFTVGRALAAMLGFFEGDALKLFTLQQKYYKGGKVEVDNADFQTTKDAVKAANVKQFNNTIKGQVLEELNDAKEKTKEETGTKKKK